MPPKRVIKTSSSLAFLDGSKFVSAVAIKQYNNMVVHRNYIQKGILKIIQRIK